MTRINYKFRQASAKPRGSKLMGKATSTRFYVKGRTVTSVSKPRGWK